MNPLFIILGITALVYAPTIFGLLKLDYRIVSVLPTKIEENKITFNAGMELTNNSSFRLMINDLNCDVWLNGTMIGTISNVFNTPIPAHHKQVLGLLIEITPNNLGAELWQSAINQNLQNFVLVLKGTITANNKTLPLNAQWTINDFVNGIGAVQRKNTGPFNHALYNELILKHLKNELKDYGITEIFIWEGELHTTSYYDIPQDIMKQIESYVLPNMF